MATVETSEVGGQKPERGRWRRFGSSLEASEADERVIRNVNFIVGHVPPKRDLIRMAAKGTSKIVEISGTPWEITVVNHTVSHDLGYDTPLRSRSIVMKEQQKRQRELRLVTDWGMKTGSNLIRGGIAVGLDSLPLNLK